METGGGSERETGDGSVSPYRDKETQNRPLSPTRPSAELLLLQYNIFRAADPSQDADHGFAGAQALAGGQSLSGFAVFDVDDDLVAAAVLRDSVEDGLFFLFPGLVGGKTEPDPAGDIVEGDDLLRYELAVFSSSRETRPLIKILASSSRMSAAAS